MKAEMLPPQVQRLFWDMDATGLDLETSRNTIIERVLNYGNLNDWKWLSSRYGQSAIQERLSQKSSSQRENLRQRSRALASLIFKVR